MAKATKPQDVPRTPPPTLSPILTDMIGEIGMIEKGYRNSVPIDKMPYFSAGIRMIAMTVYNAERRTLRL